MKYYRVDGVCIKCPDNPWILIVGCLVAAIVIGAMGWVLNKKSCNVAIMSIFIDYMQVEREKYLGDVEKFDLI